MAIKFKGEVEIGDVIRIDNVIGKPSYSNYIGTVEYITAQGLIWGSWSWWPVHFEDDWEIINRKDA